MSLEPQAPHTPWQIFPQGSSRRLARGSSPLHLFLPRLYDPPAGRTTAAKLAHRTRRKRWEGQVHFRTPPDGYRRRPTPLRPLHLLNIQDMALSAWRAEHSRRPGSFSSRLNKPPSRPRGRKPVTNSERRSDSPLQESKTPRIQSDAYSTVGFQQQFERLATLFDWHPESPIPRRDLRRRTNQRRGGRVTPPRTAIQSLGGGPSCGGGSIRVLPRPQGWARESHAAPAARLWCSRPPRFVRLPTSKEGGNSAFRCFPQAVSLGPIFQASPHPHPSFLFI